MKKFTLYLILPVFLALMVPPEITAQNDPGPDDPTKNTVIGIRIGGMISDLWFPGRTNKPVEPDDPVEPLKSLTFGISVVKDYHPRFFVFADILYERKGRGMFPVEKLKDPISPMIVTVTPFRPIALQYFSASAYFIFCTQNRPVLYLGPGIYNAILTKHYYMATNDFGLSAYKTSSSFGLHGYDVGLGLKAGIRHPIKDNLIFDFNITATSGLMPIFFRFYRAIYKADRALSYNRKDLNLFALNKTLSGTLSLSYRF